MHIFEKVHMIHRIYSGTAFWTILTTGGYFYDEGGKTPPALSRLKINATTMIVRRLAIVKVPTFVPNDAIVAENHRLRGIGYRQVHRWSG